MTFGSGFLAQVAGLWEVSARKAGNVHPGAAFADCTFLDFALSAAAVGKVFECHACHTAPVVGEMVFAGVEATRQVVGKNTNLGIVLLLAPLAAAGPGRLRSGVATVLAHDSVENARWVYAAIRKAAPGGLGDAAEQDVAAEPTVPLVEAMRLAADRDMVARQYANGFADVFDFGVPAFQAAWAKFGRVEPAVIECQLRWLAAYPDSLIARKRGSAVAEDVRQRAEHVLSLGGLDTPEGRAAGVALDRHLRSDGNTLNPGTTADLVTACLFVALRENTVSPAAPFRWDVPDWL